MWSSWRVKLPGTGACSIEPVVKATMKAYVTDVDGLTGNIRLYSDQGPLLLALIYFILGMDKWSHAQWNEITYSFPNLVGLTAAVWEW